MKGGMLTWAASIVSEASGRALTIAQRTFRPAQSRPLLVMPSRQFKSQTAVAGLETFTVHTSNAVDFNTVIAEGLPEVIWRQTRDSNTGKCWKVDLHQSRV